MNAYAHSKLFDFELIKCLYAHHTYVYIHKHTHMHSHIYFHQPLYPP